MTTEYKQLQKKLAIYVANQVIAQLKWTHTQDQRLLIFDRLVDSLQYEQVDILVDTLQKGDDHESGR